MKHRRYVMPISYFIILAFTLALSACQRNEFPALPSDAEIIFSTENDDIWEIGSMGRDGTSINYSYVPERIGHLLLQSREAGGRFRGSISRKSLLSSLLRLLDAVV